MKRPFLDTLETPCETVDISNPLTDKGFDDFFDKKLYKIETYKNLAVETSTALLDFSEYLHEKAIQMRTCGNNITLGSDGRVVTADFCRLRLCPMCQRRKALKTYAEFTQILNYLDDFSFIHLVLTVPNCPMNELRETLGYMEKCSSRLFNIKALKKAFCGIVRCTEVTYNSNTFSFHPHFHCLIAVKKSYFTSRDYISQKKLVSLWSACWALKHENIRYVSDELIYETVNTESLQVHVEKADDGALPEIAKYCVKPLELELSRKERAKVLDALFLGMHGKRLIQTYGVIKEACHDLKVDLEKCFDIDTLTNVDIEALRVYNWNYATHKFEQKRGFNNFQIVK